MATHTCPTCGKTWPENYCPECARTIDRTLTESAPQKAGTETPGSSTARALEVLSRPDRSLPPRIPPHLGPARPKVVFFYRIWCGFLLIVYLALGIYEARILTGKSQPRLGPLSELMSRDDPAMRERLVLDERESSFFGVVIAVAGAALFATGMLSPRAPWAWVVGIVAIAVSVFPCITLPGAVALLIFWIKPETRQYFTQGSHK